MKRIRKSKQKKIINILLVVFILCCLATIIYTSYNLIMRNKSINKNNDLKEELSNYVEELPEDEEKSFAVDFESLKKQNSDTVAYLKVNNTNISYVVVKGKDNYYYLDHNFNKEYNVCGWIYADYRNKVDENDKNIIIYGHNMRDGSMFGSLNNVNDWAWQSQNENRNIILMTEEYTALYAIFSTYTIKPEEYYISTDFKTDTEYKEFLNKIASRSNYNYNVDLTDTNQILTLSSCNATGDKRIVVHAKKIMGE